jgi:chromosome segregation ATPase
LLKISTTVFPEPTGGSFVMRATENVLSIVRSQPEAETEKISNDVPNLSFDDASGLVEIETQANQLLDYISKLSSLADRACVTAIRQTETAQRSEESRQTEVATLRNQLEQSTLALQERNLAFTMLENSTRDQVLTLEQRLRSAERQLEERQSEIGSLNRQISELANRPVTPGYTEQQLQQEVAKKTAASDQEIVALKNQLSQRDESAQSKANLFKKVEADLRANIVDIETRLKEAETKLHLQENQLKDKEVVIQATAAKELEIGKLIKRLSQECENLSNELQEKTRLMGQLEIKKPQTQPDKDKNVWRRMIGRLQDDPL